MVSSQFTFSMHPLNTSFHSLAVGDDNDASVVYDNDNDNDNDDDDNVDNDNDNDMTIIPPTEPETSDLDHRHKLQLRLLVLCRRSLACSVGRGAVTLWSLQPLMAEALPHPPLSLTGRIAPTNSPLQLDTGE